MKTEIVTMKITDDSGDEYRISTEDSDGDTADGVFFLTDYDDNTMVVTVPLLRALTRAAEAAASGVLLDPELTTSAGSRR